MSLIGKLTRRSVLAAALSVSALFSLGLASAQETTIKLGTMDGEEGDVWKVAAEVAKEKGLNIEIILFSDYNLPNEALNAGDIDANSFQHQPYLDEQIAQRGYQISTVGYTALFPIGVYSRKITDLSQLADNAIVGIPNDPTNGGRALYLLESFGLLKLRDDAGVLATKLDIAENPKNLDIRELDAGIISGALDELDIGVINTNWALSTGLDPDKEAIAWEKAEDNPYNNVIVVRTADIDEPWVKTLVESYNSEPVREALKEAFGKTFATSW